MRTIYVCLGCAGQYLPPESMTYPSLEKTASPVHCGNPSCEAVVEDSLAMMGVPEDVVAKWARRAAGLDGEVRRPRSGRRSRGRRPGAAPASARSKLL
ncbi:hypothetical protein OG897_13435 [Streptomyces sp. NBC_00237]|uniref:hypothetical protein n=1 Tax=Streptomyces sp. NBC_00237 TaxID=2975687 RepID=UPI0022554162|nr:hypothetical protein [Streptomyces sp. NBC_00237]MCX5202446.1 hypothetical protein [Streptomyces sp. NBC_00237]